MAKATQLAKIDSSIKISNGLERRASRKTGTKLRGEKASWELKLVKALRHTVYFLTILWFFSYFDVFM